MPSRFLTLAGLLCLSTFFFFCSKDPVVPVEESPFFDFFNESAIQIDTVEQAADTWEYGFTFTPLKNGKVTNLGLKLPVEGAFTVTLWDLSGSTPVILRSKSINSAAVHSDTFNNIPEIALQKNTKYGITVLSNSFYRMTKTGGGAFSFPKTIGNIRIDSFNETINNSSAPTFPPATNDTRVAPCVNVIFIAD